MIIDRTDRIENYNGLAEHFREAVDFVEEHVGVRMERAKIVCGYGARNRQCIGARCPFSRANY